MKVKQIIEVFKSCKLEFGYLYDDFEHHIDETINSKSDTVQITIFEDFKEGAGYQNVHEYSKLDDDKEVESSSLFGNIFKGDKFEDHVSCSDGFEINIFIK